MNVVTDYYRATLLDELRRYAKDLMAREARLIMKGATVDRTRDPFILSVDIDGVLANFTDAFRVLVQELTDVLIPPADSWDWVRRYGVTYEQETKVWAWLDKHPEWWLNVVEPYPETTMALHALWRAQWTHHAIVYFMTQRPKSAFWPTYEWLSTHGFPNPTILMIDKEAGKGSTCRDLNITHFIDDRYQSCSDVACTTGGAKVCLLQRPWSGTYDLSHPWVRSLGIVAVADLDDWLTEVGIEIPNEPPDQGVTA